MRMNTVGLMGLCLVMLAIGGRLVHGGEIVYRPVNPSFGGNPLNGQFLLNNATLQDDNEPPDRAGLGGANAAFLLSL